MLASPLRGMADVLSHGILDSGLAVNTHGEISTRPPRTMFHPHWLHSNKAPRTPVIQRTLDHHREVRQTRTTMETKEGSTTNETKSKRTSTVDRREDTSSRGTAVRLISTVVLKATAVLLLISIVDLSRGTVDHPLDSMGHLRASMVHPKVSTDLLRVSMGRLRVSTVGLLVRAMVPLDRDTDRREDTTTTRRHMV